MQIVCKRCKNTWDYGGSAKRVCCSKCRTSIMVHTREPTAIPLVSTFKLPIKLIESFKFRGEIPRLKNMGEEYVTLKADGEGVLSL